MCAPNIYDRSIYIYLYISFVIHGLFDVLSLAGKHALRGHGR
jgi:hypothetical protein